MEFKYKCVESQTLFVPDIFRILNNYDLMKLDN
jgi:hypothetical protein